MSVLLEPDWSALQEAAKQAAIHAHAPYSSFRVGAAVLWANGEVTRGVNVENASYPLGVCAERHAVAAGVLAGHAAQGPVRAVAVWAESDQSLRPCGGCRQVLQEFCGGQPQQVLLTCSHGRHWEQHTLAELLPEAFGPHSL